MCLTCGVRIIMLYWFLTIFVYSRERDVENFGKVLLLVGYCQEITLTG